MLEVAMVAGALFLGMVAAMMFVVAWLGASFLTHELMHEFLESEQRED